MLLSNDRRSLWRIRKYDEEYIARDSINTEHVSRWEVHRWTGRIDDEMGLADSIINQEWEYWEALASGLLTRKEAVDEALRLGAGET